MSEEILQSAVENTEKCYPNKAVIHRQSPEEIIICTDEEIAEEVVKEFRKLAGILPTRKLKLKSNDMEHSSHRTLESNMISKPPTSAASSHGNERMSSVDCFTANGLEIKVVTGDITKQQVDVIVNSSTANMQHYTGLAKAISLAAGPELQKECRDIIYGSFIPVGECRDSRAFKLSCKRIVHAVGPRHEGDEYRFSTLLKKTFYSALTKTDSELCFHSIAIPLISSGAQGGSIQICSEALVAALEDFSRQRFRLRQVLLINKDEETTRVLRENCLRKFKSVTQPHQGPSDRKLAPTTTSMTLAQYNTNRGLEVILEKGDITKAPVDMIVNAANKNLRHGGGVAAAISKAAGMEMQEQCRRLMRGRPPLYLGECIVTDGYRLPCKILHTAGPIYSERASDAEFYKELKKTFLSALRHANIPVEVKTIAVPLISSGIYGGPKLMCAEALLAAIEEFDREPSHIIRTIQLINLDDSSSQALLDVFSSRYSDANKGKPMSLEDTSGPDLTPKAKRRMNLYIKKDDITQQDVDIIVNPTDASLGNTFGVANAISRAAGSKFQETCNFIMKGRGNVSLATGEVIETEGFKLKCKYILHTRSPYYGGEHDNRKYKETLLKVYQRCLSTANGKTGVRSIAIPIIGAGEGRCPKELCAETLATAIKVFDEREENCHLKTIVIVSIDKEAVRAVEKLVGNQAQDNTSRSDDTFLRSVKSNHHTSALTYQHDKSSVTHHSNTDAFRNSDSGVYNQSNTYRPTATTLAANVKGDQKVWSSNPGAVPKYSTSFATTSSNHDIRSRDNESSHEGTGILGYVTPVTTWFTNAVSSAIPQLKTDVSSSRSYAEVVSRPNATTGNAIGSSSSEGNAKRLCCGKCYTDTQLKHLECCNHTFCTHCIIQYVSPSSKCLNCGSLYCAVNGKKIPTPSTMTYYIRTDLKVPREQGNGAVVIKYNFPDGILQVRIHGQWTK